MLKKPWRNPGLFYLLRVGNRVYSSKKTGGGISS
jgi:hypothetical protein